MRILTVVLTLILLTITAAATSGCAGLRSIAESYQVPEKAAKAIDNYCDQLPLVERSKNRASVNALTQKGDIAVHCTGDPPVSLP